MTVKAFHELKSIEKENRKQVLLQIAEDIVHENSLEEATIRNVAQKAGLSAGAIYIYFKSKEDLLLAILIKNLRKLQSEIETLKDKNDPVKALRAMALAYRNYFINCGKYVDIFRHLTEREGKELISEKNKIELLETLGGIFRVIEEMAAWDNVKKHTKGISPQRLIPIIWSIALGVSQMTLSTHGEVTGFDFDQVINDFIYLIFEKQER